MDHSLQPSIPTTITQKDICHLRQRWMDFEKYMKKKEEKREYVKQNCDRILNGAGKFVDFLCGIESQKNTSYVDATEDNWPTDRSTNKSRG